MIVEHVWDMDYDGLTNIVDVYIRHLRSKIDDKWPEKMIQTVRGIGYMLDMPDEAGESERCLETCMARFTRVFGVPKLRVGFVRGLRFRLTVELRAVLHDAAGRHRLVFRQTPADREWKATSRATLEAEWGARQGISPYRQ